MPIIRFTPEYLENNNETDTQEQGESNIVENNNVIIRNKLPYKKTTFSRCALNANKKNISASWDKCLKNGECLELKYQNQVIQNEISNKKQKPILIQNQKRGWRRVAWSRFKLEQGTSEYNNVRVGNSNQPRCSDSNTNQLTIDEIRDLPNDSFLLDTGKLDCVGSRKNQYLEEEFMKEEVEEIYIR